MSEEEIRAIVRDELEKCGGIDIGEAIAMQTRTICVGMLKQIGAEQFLSQFIAGNGGGWGH